MRDYIKPTIEFIELKPEERLACESGGSKPSMLISILGCKTSFQMGSYCSISNFKKYNMKICK